jgi:hypothetical protein
MKPLLLVDVDGVICPRPRENGVPAGFALRALEDAGFYAEVLVSDSIASMLRTLARTFDLMWASAWEERANRVLAPLLGLPKLPVIEFSNLYGYQGRSWKLGAIQASISPLSPLAWIDDEIYDDALGWAAFRSRGGVPTLALPIDPTRGLRDYDLTSLYLFAEEVERRAA